MQKNIFQWVVIIMIKLKDKQLNKNNINISLYQIVFKIITLIFFLRERININAEIAT